MSGHNLESKLKVSAAPSSHTFYQDQEALRAMAQTRTAAYVHLIHGIHALA